MDAEQLSSRRRRTGTKVLGLGAVTASVAMVATALIAPVANADVQTVTSVSAAHGHTLWAEGLGLDVAGSGASTTEWTAAGANEAVSQPLNLSLLGSNDLGIDGLDLPIVKETADDAGLLWLGSAGVLESYSSSPGETQSISASGVLGDDGALNLSELEGTPGENANLDLTNLLDQLGLAGLTDEVLDEASIELGALGARAEQNGTAVDTEYGITDLNLNLHSQALDGVTGTVEGAVGGIATSLDGLLAADGALSQTVTTLVNALNVVYIPLLQTGVNAEITQPLSLDTSALTSSVTTELLATPLNNATATDEASVNIDLSTGTISVNLAALLLASDGPFAGKSLSELDPNTDLLTDDVLNSVVSGVTNALIGDAATYPNSLTSKVVNLVQDGVYGLELGLGLQVGVEVLGGGITNTTVALQSTDGTPATVGGLLGITGYTPATLKIADEGVLAAVLSLVQPLLDTALAGIGTALGGVVTPALATLQTSLSALLEPLTATLLGGDNPLLKQVLDGTANLTANVQPAELDPAQPGDFGAGSTTVRALGITVLPGLGANAVNVQIGSATVQAADEDSPENSVDARAAASSSASAEADGDNTAAAEGAAEAAAFADSSSQASVKGSANATTASEAAARADVEAGASATASADSTSDANAAANAAAEGGTADNSDDSKASASATASANSDASASSEASAASDAYSAASADASSAANGTADDSGTPGGTSDDSADPEGTSDDSSDPEGSSDSSTNVNASASAAADAKGNPAAQAAAIADATNEASAAADANTAAAAEAAATADSSNDASADSSGASANVSAQAAADANNESSANANASSEASANVAAAAKAAATADSSSNASEDATSDTAQDAQTNTNANANTDVDGNADANGPGPDPMDCMVSPTRSPFTDNSPTLNPKFYDEIEWMWCMNYTTGILQPDGSKIYGPQMRLSREAMAAFIYRMEAPKNYKAPSKSPFADMKQGDKFYKEIVWMYEEGLSTGIKQDNGSIIYGPKLRLSREAMAAFIYRLEDPSGYHAPAKSKMADMHRGDKFYTEINWMVDEGLSTGIGVENGKREYWPKSRLSREAMAAFIYRLQTDYRQVV